jgi:hypothetical protein
MMRDILILAALSLVAAHTTPALAATVPATAPAVIVKATPEAMLSILKAAGYTAKLGKSGENPEITLTRKSGQQKVYLNFQTCKTGGCERVDAYTYYNAGDLDTAPEESNMTTWNTNNYTQAYIDTEDDDSVNLDSLYYLSGGFTKANFLYWLKKFEKDADSFDEMLKGL